MLIRIFSAALMSTLLGLPLAGCPNCPYDSQCEGNILKTCSVGVDQVAGDPARSSKECVGPNPVCVNLDDQTAQCAMDNTSECDLEFIPRCEGGVVVDCANGYLVAEDCEGHGNDCYELAPGPRCALNPLTDCDPEEFEARCGGHSVVSCVDGYLKTRDCSLDYEGGTCEEYENDYGRSAYCVGS